MASGGANTSAGGTQSSGGSAAAGASSGGNGSSNGGGNNASGGATGTGGNNASGAGDSVAGSTGTGGGPTVDLPAVVTSAQDAYWKTGQLTEVTSGTADVTVNDSSPAQTFDGFGGAFNEKGWDYLSQLSEADRDTALKLLFGDDGARFVSGRIPIGANDYAMDRYSLNEMANDTTMANFSIERDRQKLIPFVKAALKIRPDLNLWASPWTPPTWMKTNKAFDRGNMKEDDTTFAAYALYLAKFVQEYEKEGIHVRAVHPQNEPGFEQDYPSCLWTGAGMAKFIGAFLGPTFEKEKVNAQIYLGTMSNNSADPAIITAVTKDTTAMQYVKGFGLQWGMIGSVSGLKSRNLPIMQTEHKCGNYPWMPSDYPNFNKNKAPNDIAYALESWTYLRDWIKAGVTHYAAWNMVLDPVGLGIDVKRVWPQNALLVADVSAKKLIITPAYYVFRHLSQYVEPGAKVVGTSGGDALAFKNPSGKLVAVLYNSGAAKKAIVAIGGKKMQFDMPAKGWATVSP